MGNCEECGVDEYASWSCKITVREYSAMKI